MADRDRRLPAAPTAPSLAPAANASSEEGFSVDTGLFRELGELLVGRDSTALVELIKNAYDADATSVTVVARDLGSARTGVIIVSDDGNGMTLEEFRRGFLRVASRLKNSGDRRSPVYRRRFTGAKGIGRLAAHKLASQLAVNARAVAERVPHDKGREAAGELSATIDWDEVERHDTLESVGDAIKLAAKDPGSDAKPGTTITLSTLRRRWSDRERMRFVREVSTFQPGQALREAVAPTYVAKRLLFDSPIMRESKSDAGFAVTLGGEFDVGDDYSVDVLSAASWVVEIDAAGDTVEYAVAPTRSYARSEKISTDPITATMSRERSGGTFQARIFVRSGTAPDGLTDAYGVRVYMEGFRVLPYGEPGDDWLDVNRRYAQRGRGVPFVGEVDAARVSSVTDKQAGLIATPLRGIFGGVFLTEAGAPSLRMLVNREGFVPDETFLDISDAVSNGLALQTRVNASLRPNRGNREARRGPATGGKAAALVDQPTKRSLDVAVEGIRSVAARSDVSSPVREQLMEAEEHLIRIRDDVIDEQSMLRILASLGTQTAAFIHEINAALGSISSLKRSVDAMLVTPPDARELAGLQRRVDALQRTIERQSAYLVEIVSPDARRRRSRRRYADHFDIAALLLEEAASRDNIGLHNDLPRDLKTPPMFPAEITSIFTNLLSNAIKAAGRGGRVQAGGTALEERSEVTVQNTGVAVDLATAQEWFDPYRSTTVIVDPSLGQGMGLGLTITRTMLAEYRGTINFVEPGDGFATAVRLSLPR